MITSQLTPARRSLGRPMPVRVVASVGALFGALVLAGCGAVASSPGAPAPSSTAGSDSHAGHAMPSASPSAGAVFNSADAMFAQMMIPHHEQAVSMSETVLAKPGLDGRVAALAERIKKAQAPEIATLKGLLAAWGQPAAMPTSSSADPGAAGAGSPGAGSTGGGSTGGSSAEAGSADPGSADPGSAGAGSAGAGHSMEGMMSSADLAQLSSADAPTASKLFLSQMVAHHEGAVRMAQTEKSAGKNVHAVAMASSIVDSQTQEIAEIKALLAGL